MELIEQISNFEFSEIFKKEGLPQWNGSFYWLELGRWKIPGFELFMKTGTTLRSCTSDKFITYESQYEILVEVNDNNAVRAFTTQELGEIIGLYTAAIPNWHQGLKVWGFRPDSKTAKPLFDPNENNARCACLRYLLVTDRVDGKLVDKYFMDEFIKRNGGKEFFSILQE